MVESSIDIQNPETKELSFYDKSSGFNKIGSHQMEYSKKGLHYPLVMAQSQIHQGEVALASSDFSLNLMDLQTLQIKNVSQDAHVQPIHSVKYSKSQDNESLANVLFSCSEDGFIKVWDRRQAGQTTECAAQLAANKNNSTPFYSVDASNSVICGGAKNNLLFWDIKKMQKPIMVFEESHADDITQICFLDQQNNGQRMISCGVDNLLCMFDFSQGNNEDDCLEGVYSSSQALINCGQVDQEGRVFWLQTSVNTIEFVRSDTADMFHQVSKFPHPIDYLISCQMHQNRFIIFAGNNLGEVFIYEVSSLWQAYEQYDGLVKEASLKLIDMILTNVKSVVRQIQFVRGTDDTIVLTNELGRVEMFKFNVEQKQQNEQQAMANMMELDDLQNDLQDNDDENMQTDSKNKKQRAFRPY